MLDKAIRELDRERMGLQQQEKKIVMEIKKMAKEGQMVCTQHRIASHCHFPLSCTAGGELLLWWRTAPGGRGKHLGGVGGKGGCLQVLAHSSSAYGEGA